MNILVVDADEETRLTLVEVIAAADPTARISEACDGQALRAALAGTAPDLLFIDTILPGADAGDIMAWRTSAGAGSVIVLVTDLLAPRWPRIARRIDAYDVILKPVGPRNVEHVLKAAALLRQGLRVLLAEPGERMRRLTRQVLEQSLFDFEVFEAADGAAAVRASRQQTFDLVLIGNGLPDVPALEVSCRINALQPDARILVVGREIEAMTPAQLALFGAQAFLRRPFSSADIDRTVYETFGLWQPYLVRALRQEEAHTATVRSAAATA